MALRLLPFRQYDEHDVINGFFMNVSSATEAIEDPDMDGTNANGVLVFPAVNNLNEDRVKFTDFSASHLVGKVHSSPIGRNQYPYSASYVSPVNTTAGVQGTSFKPIGITLNQTLKYDENGQPLQYYPQKLDELQAVLPYKPVPIATKGIFTLTEKAFNGTTFAPGTKLSAGYTNAIRGKFVNMDEVPGFIANNPVQIGTVLATGSRAAGDAYAGKYYIIKLDCT